MKIYLCRATPHGLLRSLGRFDSRLPIVLRATVDCSVKSTVEAVLSQKLAFRPAPDEELFVATAAYQHVRSGNDAEFTDVILVTQTEAFDDMALWWAA
ncbi:hypothetical protein KC320_g102 [Hortaea werneckii]|nr:hypothetical protein KC320_g102 [Hortaea werneckii]